MSIEALAFPFSVGMLAAFNPCGFAMLPTYIGYFIGTGDTEQPTRVRAITRGLWVGSILTLGFVAVFGGLGILISLFLSQGTVVKYLGYVTMRSVLHSSRWGSPCSPAGRSWSTSRS